MDRGLVEIRQAPRGFHAFFTEVGITELPLLLRDRRAMDPIRFEKDLKVTIQALGWRSGWRYLPLQDDIASTAFWYQTEPHAPFPKLPDRDYLEVR